MCARQLQADVGSESATSMRTAPCCSCIPMEHRNSSCRQPTIGSTIVHATVHCKPPMSCKPEFPSTSAARSPSQQVTFQQLQHSLCRPPLLGQVCQRQAVPLNAGCYLGCYLCLLLGQHAPDERRCAYAGTCPVDHALAAYTLKLGCCCLRERQQQSVWP